MRICSRCRKEIGDNETFCSRCGSTQFIEGPRQQTYQGQPQQMGNRPMPQGRPIPNNGNVINNNQFNGGRPIYNMGQPQQMQGNRPIQNMGTQQMQGRPIQNMGQPQMQNTVQNNMYGNNQMQGRPMQNIGQQQMNVQEHFVNQTTSGYTAADFTDIPNKPEKSKKKLFLGKNKKEKMYEEMKQMNASANNTGTTTQVQNQTMQNMPISSMKQPVVQQDASIITVFDWIITMILMMIPIVNIVYIIKTLMDKTMNISKKNYIKAYLVWYIISLVIVIILFITGAVKLLF